VTTVTSPPLQQQRFSSLLCSVPCLPFPTSYPAPLPLCPARTVVSCALPRVRVPMLVLAPGNVRSPTVCGSDGAPRHAVRARMHDTLTGQALRRLPKWVLCSHHFAITVRAPARERVPEVPGADAVMEVPYRAAVRNADGQIIEPEQRHVPGVDAVPRIPEVPYMPADIDVRSTNFKYWANLNHFYIAYRDWCKHCCVTDHLTQNCSARPAAVVLPPPPPARPVPPQQRPPQQPPPVPPPPVAWPIAGAPQQPPQVDGWQVVNRRRGRAPGSPGNYEDAHRARRADE
jgi:hypothetical protein